MNLDDLERIVKNPTLGRNGSIEFDCPIHGEGGALARQGEDGIVIKCIGGCSLAELCSGLGIKPEDLQSTGTGAALFTPNDESRSTEPNPNGVPPTPDVSEIPVEPPPVPLDPHEKARALLMAPDHAATREAGILDWEGQLKNDLEIVRADQPKLSRETFSDFMLAHAISGDGAPPEFLKMSINEIEGSFAKMLDVVWPLKNGNGKALITIPWESHELALVANEAYLQRTPVIDKLCYSSAVSMITGGKHAGKSTLARWAAISVVKGYKFLKREVIKGPVVYIASEDETMAARQELLNLGWAAEDPLKFLSVAALTVTDKLKRLEALTHDIKAHGVTLVVFDMLFDFVDISNELSYAETQRELGRIQDVASITGAHVIVTHHAPKHSQVSDAGITALGSQGIAAKVSPIILVRRFGAGVHSVVSTAVRDPRGEAIIESRLQRNQDGSVTLAGAWKTHMLGEVYMPQVMELMEDEGGAEMTASDVAAALEVNYKIASSCLFSLYNAGKLRRLGDGRKGKPFRYSNILAEQQANISRLEGTGYIPPRKSDGKIDFEKDVGEWFEGYKNNKNS